MLAHPQGRWLADIETVLTKTHLPRHASICQLIVAEFKGGQAGERTDGGGKVRE